MVFVMKFEFFVVYEVLGLCMNFMSFWVFSCCCWWCCTNSKVSSIKTNRND